MSNLCMAIYIDQLRRSVVVEKKSVCQSVIGLRRFRILAGHAAHIGLYRTTCTKLDRIVKLVTAGIVVTFVHCDFWYGFLVNSLNIAVEHIYIYIYKSMIEYVNNCDQQNLICDIFYNFYNIWFFVIYNLLIF